MGELHKSNRGCKIQDGSLKERVYQNNIRIDFMNPGISSTHEAPPIRSKCY